MFRRLALASIITLVSLSACHSGTALGDADGGSPGQGGTAGFSSPPATAGAPGGTAGNPGTAGDGTAGNGGGTGGNGGGTAGIGGGTAGFPGGTGGTISVNEAACEKALATQSNQTPTSFLAEVVLPIMANWYLSALALGDLNGDQKADVAVGYSFFPADNGQSGAAGAPPMGAVGVFVADAAHGFAAPAIYTPSGLSIVSSVAIGDVDGDGKLDLVASDGSVRIFANTGAGALTATPTTYSVGTSSNAIGLGDLDGDGKLDIVVPTPGSDPSENGVAVLTNAGGGSFIGKRYVVGDGADEFVVGDVDGDGKPDVVLSGMTGVDVLLDDGMGALLGSKSYLAPAPYGSLALGDVDGDGRPDVLVSANGAVDALLNLGKGTFAVAKKAADADLAETSFAVGDLDGDHRPDLVVSFPDCGAVAVSLNDGTGGFGTPFYYRITGRPDAIAIGDVNGDGRADLVVLNGKSASVLVHSAP